VTQKNAGIAATRNAAAALAKGRYIATHDNDDVFHPVRLEKQASLLDARPDLAAVFCRSLVTDENLRPLAVMRVVKTPPALRRCLRRGNPLQNNYMIRREVFERIGGYRDAFTLSEDFDFKLRLLEAGEVLCMPEAYHIYRRHPGQTSVVREAQMIVFSALVRTFEMERRLRGRDSYAEFDRIRDFEKFLPDYEFRNHFYFFAGRNALRHLLLPQARAYIKEAWKGGHRTFAAARTYAGARLPHVFIKALLYFKARFLQRKWTRKIPPDMIEMLSSENVNAGRRTTSDK
jgi:glycosyltransferase involved in cell wall biosynthesis